MTSSPLPTDLGLLVEQRERLARFAAHLLADGQGGEDVVQDGAARLAKAEHSPTGTDREAWLRGFIKRLALNERRGRQRRRRRETIAAREERTPSSDEIVARLEVERQLHAAVDALPEPQANAIRDHYFGGLSVAVLAERDGLSREAVKSRIRRGRAALRDDLERRGLGAERGAERGNWRLALAPIAALPTSHSAGTAVLLATTMKKLLVLAAGLAALLVGGHYALSLADADLDRPIAEDTDRVVRGADGPERALGGEPDASAVADTDRRMAINLDDTEETDTIVATTSRGLAVRSSVGLELVRVFGSASENSKRSPLRTLESGVVQHPGDAWVSAPGHRAVRVIATDESIALEPASMLVVEARDLRGATHRILDPFEWTGADEAAKYHDALTWGFLDADRFALALDHQRWPNYSLAPGAELELADGSRLEARWTPKGDEPERVEIELEPRHRTGERRDLAVALEPPVDAGRVRFRLALADGGASTGWWSLANGVVELREPHGHVQHSSTATSRAVLPDLVVGQRYRIAAAADSGAIGFEDFEFDGSPITLELQRGARVIGSVMTDDDAPAREATIHVEFAEGADGSDPPWAWAQALKEPRALSTMPDGGFDVAVPWDVPWSTKAPWPMPETATLVIGAPGLEPVRHDVRLRAGETIDLGHIVLAPRAGGWTIEGRPELIDSTASSQVFWIDLRSDRAGWANRIDSYATTEGERHDHYELWEGSGDVEPDEVYFFGDGVVRAVKTAPGRYWLEEPLEASVRFELDEEMGDWADGAQVHVRLRGHSLYFYRFYAEAFGSARTISGRLPATDAVLAWRGVDASGKPNSDWFEIGPTDALPEVARIRRDR